MKKDRMLVRMRAAVVCLLLAAAGPAPGRAAPAHSAGDKMTVEELVAKHLESIGTAEARASVHNRIVGGSVVTTLRSPATAQFSGQAVIASEGNKSVIGMGFENSSYSQEKFVFDGEDVTIGYVRPGARSNLGDFLQTYNGILKYGLMGGTLTEAWPLLHLPDKKQKLESGGTRKIGGRPAYELKFVPRGGTDLQISLFFDAETFQHVRTEYTRFISAGIGANADASGAQRATRYKMVEEFSDFRKEGALTLPHGYKIGLELDTRGGTFQGEWQLTLNQFAFNQPIPPATFNAGGSK